MTLAEGAPRRAATVTDTFTLSREKLAIQE